MIKFNKDTKNKSALSTRWAQMSKQEQIIEKKKMEIQSKLEAQKQAAALAAHAKLTQIGTPEEKNPNNIFSNDGSFMNNFKALLEKQKKDKEEKEKLEREKEQPPEEDKDDSKHDVKTESNAEEYNYRDNNDRGRHSHRDSGRHSHHRDERRRSDDGGHRDRHHRWNERGRNQTQSPMDDRQTNDNKNIPSLMQIPIRPPNEDDSDPDGSNQWNMQPGPSFNMNDQGPMGPGSHVGLSNNMGPGPNMGPGQNMNMGPMMGGHNMPPMPPGGPMHPGGPMPSFMGGPPNFGPMPPFMGPNGPVPNMCGPNGPNGPMPPFFGPNGPMPPFPNGPMMGPNGPPPPPPNMMPHSMNSGNRPYMGQPPFGSAGPNFGGNAPQNMPFMPPNNMPQNPMLPHQRPDPKPDNQSDSMSNKNIQPPMPPMSMNHIPQPNDLDHGNIPLPPKSQVLSADPTPPAIQRAATDVARNGDHWENVLKATQDPNMWFLHNTNSSEYQAFRELVNRLKAEKKPEVKPEDKYEPEFSLEDDDSSDGHKYAVKDENSADNNSDSKWGQQYPWSHKGESSQSDDEERRERRRKKRSRWGDDPPVDVQPLMPPLPPAPQLPPAAKLAKIEEDGLKLSAVNRNNQALMQYAMMNFGTTNLSAEDWKKCEDNFKLNLLYQDMLKKRNEVERLAAAGKHKYEYDSDEDTAEGTWEHKLRSREMNATERWADELTKQAAGKHHIGDFLPPEELKKFMEKYSAAKMGKEPDLSDYKEFKLKEDNVGFKMLQKLGWSEGQGLGVEGTGIVNPINKSNQPGTNLGLGAATGDAVSPDDDEFDAYRKRMMLAYRFRPNPLNNPRRPYY